MTRRGMCVVLFGPDGAGKTTLGKSLDGALPASVRYVYSGLWQKDHLHGWHRRIPGAQRALRLFRVASIGLRARFHRLRGNVVVLDRSPHEVWLRGDDAGLLARLLALAVRILTPVPDLVILLDAPGEVLFARKGEHSVEILEGNRQSYRALLEKFPAHAVIDARLDADTVRRCAAEAIRHHWAATRPRVPARATSG
jgi:thymidylate kinase